MFSERGHALITQAMETLRSAEQALALRIGAESVAVLREALMADWGPIMGEQRAPGRKRTIVESSG